MWTTLAVAASIIGLAAILYLVHKVRVMGQRQLLIEQRQVGTDRRVSRLAKIFGEVEQAAANELPEEAAGGGQSTQRQRWLRSAPPIAAFLAALAGAKAWVNTHRVQAAAIAAGAAAAGALLLLPFLLPGDDRDLGAPEWRPGTQQPTVAPPSPTPRVPTSTPSPEATEPEPTVTPSPTEPGPVARPTDAEPGPLPPAGRGDGDVSADENDPDGRGTQPQGEGDREDDDDEEEPCPSPVPTGPPGGLPQGPPICTPPVVPTACAVLVDLDLPPNVRARLAALCDQLPAVDLPKRS